ncbi:MAG: hypothetical protein ACI9OJ_003527 [Myxococcota bacterium]|jgi:hypothetical protein
MATVHFGFSRIQRFPLQTGDGGPDGGGQRHLHLTGVVETDDPTFPSGGDSLLNRAEHSIVHGEPVGAYIRNPSGNFYRIWMAEGAAEDATRLRENRSNTGGFHRFDEANSFEARHPNVFKVTKVDGIIDVPEGIHIAPGDRPPLCYRPLIR